MQEAATEARFEVAARWREKFEQLEWLLAATSRARTAVDLLTFVYRDPGDFGDDRVYLVRQGLVRATAPQPDHADRARGLPRGGRRRAGQARAAGGAAPAGRRSTRSCC